MSIATSVAATPRTINRRVAISRGLKRHFRLVAALEQAVARHGLNTNQDCSVERGAMELGTVLADAFQHPEVQAASDAVNQSSYRLIWHLLWLYDDAEVPNWTDWFHGTAPIVRHRVGRQLVLVVPGFPPSSAGNGGLDPQSFDDVIGFSRLVIVDLD